jgi:hypothetical protein
VWHASGRGDTKRESERLARMALNGVGDAALGEWVEQGERGVVHVRRRLSAAEQAEHGLEVRDIRGTPEETWRQLALIEAAPHLAPIIGLSSA